MSWRLLEMLTSDAGGDEAERSRGNSSGAGMEWDRTGGGGRGLALCVGGMRKSTWLAAVQTTRCGVVWPLWTAAQDQGPTKGGSGGQGTKHRRTD